MTNRVGQKAPLMTRACLVLPSFLWFQLTDLKWTTKRQRGSSSTRAACDVVPAPPTPEQHVPPHPVSLRVVHFVSILKIIDLVTVLDAYPTNRFASQRTRRISRLASHAQRTRSCGGQQISVGAPDHVVSPQEWRD